MPPSRVRLGVIGLGAVAQAVHLPLLRNRRELFEVTAVCDLSAELAGRVAERFGLGTAGRFRSAEELLDSGRHSARSRSPTPWPRPTRWSGWRPRRAPRSSSAT
jgi:hypothetical protein